MADLISYNYVFYNAGTSGDGITVTIGANVTKIPAYLFYESSSSNAPKLTIVKFAEGSVCESIGGSAFCNCTSLTSVTIPSGVTSIGSSAFYNCTGLTEINYNATAVADLTSSSNVFYIAGTNGDGITVNIGANVTKIPAYLFYGSSRTDSTKLISVQFADGSVCESIGINAFMDCRDLTSIYIPASVTTIYASSISDSPFYSCSSTLVINCEVTEANKPSGWGTYWNYTSGSKLTVHWGVANPSKAS